MKNLKNVAAAPLSDGRIQAWAVDNNGKIWSAWQLNNNSNDQWTFWNAFSAPPKKTKMIAVAPLSDKRLQLWAVDVDGNIWSCWKSTTSSNAAWTGWSAFQGLSKKTTTMAAAPLSDGRLQIWAIDSDGKMFSCWKSTTSSNAAWTGWSAFQGISKAATSICGAPLSDGRLQIWVTDVDGKMFSCWKSTTSSSAAWTAWSAFQGISNPVKAMSAAPLSDKRLQIWALDSNGTLFSCWKSSTSSNAAWTGWTSGWNSGGTLPKKATAIATAPLSDKRLENFAIDESGCMWVCWKNTTASNSAWIGWALFFIMQRQEQTQWCWSAVSTSTSHFYDLASTWTQCALANAELNQTTCCVDGSSSQCNIPWYLDRALTEVGNYDSKQSSAASFNDTKTQVEDHQPLGVRIGWNGGGGHFVIICGTGSNNMLVVEDPWYGQSVISYNTLDNNYQGSGSWTHSYFTKSNLPTV